MEIQTRDFGKITIQEEDIVSFIQPIFGFEDMTKYVFLFDQSECSRFVWLQSIEDKDVCFILADPSVVKSDYKPALSKNDVGKLGDGENMLWLVMVVDDDFSKSTVNLKSPIILNLIHKKAMQIILDDNYPIRCPFVHKEKDGM